MLEPIDENKRWIYYSLPEEGYDHWNKYAYGYKEAALLLIKEFENSNAPITLENLIFPIFFLYRHFTELLMKEIILDFAKLKNEKTSIPTTHNLNSLWERTKPIINEIFFDQESGYHMHLQTTFTIKDVEKLDLVIGNLNKYDKHSFSFRYPIDKNGNNSLNIEFQASIETLKIEIYETFSSLDFTQFMIFHLKHGVGKS